MNKKAIIITVSSILLVGAGIGTFVYFRNKKKKKEAAARGGDSTPTAEEVKDMGGAMGEPDETEYTISQKISGDKELKFGAKGRRVALLQALLNHLEGQSLKIDGAFGNQTRMALLKSGFPMCAIASQCDVTDIEFLEMMKEAKKDKSFFKKYNYKTNSEIKSVWDKYSS